MLSNKFIKRTSKITWLKGLMGSFVFCIFSISNLNAQVQGLLLNYFEIPDTIYLESLVPVDFSISNTTSSNILGNLKINFRNETLNNIEAPLGGFEAVQFFAPNQEREFTTFIPVEPEYFIEGGNTVVIWPSFVGQSIPAVDSIRVVVFVGAVNGTTSNPPSLSEEFVIPNPVSNYLEFIPKNGAQTPKEVTLFSVTGKLMLSAQAENQGIFNISQLPAGIYFIRARMSNDKIGYFKFLKN